MARLNALLLAAAAVAFAAAAAAARASAHLLSPAALADLDRHLPLSSSANYVVELRDGSDPLDAAAAIRADGHSGGDRVTMTAADGTTYDCHLPTPRSSEAVLESEAAAKLRALSAAANFGGMDGNCIQKQAGYWSTMLCPGRYIRQFHVAATLPPSPEVENAMGRYDADGDALRVQPSGVVEYVQSYTGGSDGRATTVRFVCEPAWLTPGLQQDFSAVTEVAPLRYDVEVGTRVAAMCDLLPSPSRLLHGANGTCVRAVSGWWTYVLCVGKALRQHHDEGEGKVVQESLLGTYDWAYGERLVGGDDAADAAVAPGTPASLIQRYTRGSPCNVKGGVPRAATVRFECMPALTEGSARGRSGSIVLLDVREPETCVYDVVVGSAAACEHPTIAGSSGGGGVGGGLKSSRRAAPQPPPATIACVPALSSSPLGQGAGFGGAPRRVAEAESG